MKFGIDWSEASTKRNAVWFAAFLIGLPMVWMGKDPGTLMLLAAGVAGGMGVAIKD